MRCDPANSIIKRLGGVAAVADAASVKHSTVLRWRMPKAKGGTGGVIPHWHLHKLMAEAERRGVALDPAEFVPSRPAAEERRAS